MKRFLPALLAVYALTLTGCGDDEPGTTTVTLPSVTVAPTVEPSLLDLDGSASASPTDPAETETEASGSTDLDAQVLVDALVDTRTDTDGDRVWLGARHGEKAARALGVSLSPGNSALLVADVDGLRFVCVEAGEQAGYTFVTATEDAEAFRTGEGGCPEADIEAVRSLADLSSRVAEAKTDAKEARQAQKAAEARQTRKAERRKVVEELEAAEALEVAVSSDARMVGALLALDLRDANQVPTVGSNLAGRVTNMLSMYGLSLAGDNSLGYAKAVRAGFAVCVEAGDEGPSASFTTGNSRLVASEAAC